MSLSVRSPRDEAPWYAIVLVVGVALACLTAVIRLSPPSGAGVAVRPTSYREALCAGANTGCEPCGPGLCYTEVLVPPRGRSALPVTCNIAGVDLPQCTARFPSGGTMEARIWSWSPDGRFALSCVGLHHDSPGCGFVVWDLTLGVPLYSLFGLNAWSEWKPGEPHTLIYIAKKHARYESTSTALARLNPLRRDVEFLAECPDWLTQTRERVPVDRLREWCAELELPDYTTGQPIQDYGLGIADQPFRPAASTAASTSRWFARELRAPDGRRLARLSCHEHPDDTEAHCAGRLASGLRLELAGEPRWSPSGRYALIRLPHSGDGALGHFQVWDLVSGRPLELELPRWDTFVWSPGADVLAYIWSTPISDGIRLLDAPAGTVSGEPSCPDWYESAPPSAVPLKLWCRQFRPIRPQQ